VSRRAVAPVVGVLLLVAVTVVLAAIVGIFAAGVVDQVDDVPEAAITAGMATGERYGNPKIVLTHVSGDDLDVRDLTVRIFVDGEPLKHQPDIPFFSQTGFISGPDGPFNSETANTVWTAGEETSLTIAGTNSPQPTAGSPVTVKIYTEGEIVATART
jgi:flagellin-like protein